MAKELHSRISELSTSFVDSILDAIKGSSLHELLGTPSIAGGAGRHAPRETGAPSAARGRRPAARAATPARAIQTATPASGRLRRRSAEDIAKILEVVVSLLGSRKNGLRAEQIRTELSLQAKELPRILKEGLDRKKLRTVGQKRATTYFVK